MRARIVVIAMLVMVGAIAAPAAPATEELLRDFGVQLPHERKPAPDFTLQRLDGSAVSLSDYRGQLILLHFWATWCVPCRHEMPLLHDLAQRKLSRFHVLCVNVDRNNRRAVQSFIDEVTPRFQTLLDPAGDVRNRYAVRGLPTTYLIGPDGRIIGRLIGEREWNSAAAIALLKSLTQQRGRGMNP